MLERDTVRKWSKNKIEWLNTRKNFKQFQIFIRKISLYSMTFGIIHFHLVPVKCLILVTICVIIFKTRNSSLTNFKLFVLCFMPNNNNNCLFVFFFSFASVLLSIFFHSFCFSLFFFSITSKLFSFFLHFKIKKLLNKTNSIFRLCADSLHLE